MEYDTYIGPETTSKEYKEFSFQHIGLYYTDDEIDEFTRNFKWEFNHLVEQSICRYIQLYVPRYTCAFLDRKTDQGTYELYIGIDDDGYVKGIPYQGKLTSDLVLSHKSLEYLKSHIQCNDEYMEDVSVEIIEVNYFSKKLDTTHPVVKTYDKKKKKLTEKIRKQAQVYLRWHAKNEHYSQKLVDLYYHIPSRAVFVKYLKKHKQYNLVDMISKGFMIEQKSYDKIKEYREGGDNMYYWLCTWKDDILNKIRSKKPAREINKPDVIYGPMHIFSKVGELAPWWLQHNSDMKLYVIKFTFTNKNNKNFTYTDHRGKEGRCYRGLLKGIPACIPY
jgi:hypothetical protein